MPGKRYKDPVERLTARKMQRHEYYMKKREEKKKEALDWYYANREWALYRMHAYALGIHLEKNDPTRSELVGSNTQC